MKDDWFLKGLLLSEEECSVFRRKEWTDAELNTEEGCYQLCQWWARRFFEESNGLTNHDKILNEILAQKKLTDLSEAENMAMRKKHRLFLRNLGLEGDIKNWFFSHCWMIGCMPKESVKDEEKIQGATSPMPLIINRCYTEEMFNPDAYQKEYFKRLLEDTELCGLLRQALFVNRAQYHMITDALDRYLGARDYFGGTAAWYLHVNGEFACLKLGVTELDFPKECDVRRRKVTIGDVSRNVSDDENAVFFSERELKGMDWTKVEAKVGGHKADLADDSLCLDINAINAELTAGHYLFFDVAPGATMDYRSILLKDSSAYCHKIIWIVGKGSQPPAANWCRSLPLDGHNGVVCWKYDLSGYITDEPQAFPLDGAAKLFTCQKRHKLIDFEGFDEDICDVRHKWHIFSGSRASLVSPDSQEWSEYRQEQSEGVAFNGNRCTLTALGKIQSYPRLRGCLQNYYVLHIPQDCKEKICGGEAFSDGDWEYMPESRPHIKMIQHKTGMLHGILANRHSDERIALRVSKMDMAPLPWLVPGGGDCEEYEEEECQFHDYKRWSEFGRHYLWIAPLPEDAHYVIHHFENDHECSPPTEKTINGGRGAACFDEPIGDILESSGEFNENRYDMLCLKWACKGKTQETRLFSVRCIPGDPLLFQRNAQWKIFMPNGMANEWQLVFLSEKFLDKPNDSCNLIEIPCECEALSFVNEIADIGIPEKMPPDYAVHVSLLKKAKSSLPVSTRLHECRFIRIRPATAKGTSFEDAGVVQLCLDFFKDTKIDLSDVHSWLATSHFHGSAAEYWRQVAGCKAIWSNPEESVAYVLRHFLNNGYNFLAEPSPEDDHQGNFGKTWLANAWSIFHRNWTGQDWRHDSFGGIPKNREAVVKAFISNQDTTNENHIKGEGWLSCALALYLFHERGWWQIRTDATVHRNQRRLRLADKFERSGLRELTRIEEYNRIWPFQLNGAGCTMSLSGFRKAQASLYGRDPFFCSDDPVYCQADLDRTQKILNAILESLNKAPAGCRLIGMHLREAYIDISTNVKDRYEDGAEDLESAVLGLAAIVCRLLAHANCGDLLDQNDREFICSIIRKAFEGKYNERNNKDSGEYHDASRRWQYLMLCIVSVEASIVFFNRVGQGLTFRWHR